MSSPWVGRAATEAEETESPRAADGVAGSAGTTATVRKSDRVFRKLNALALFSVPLLLGTPSCKQFERRLQMSTQEIIRELTKLNRDELAQVDLKLHELLEEKIGAGGRSLGEALLEVAGTVEGLPPDYAESHDHYLQPRR